MIKQSLIDNLITWIFEVGTFVPQAKIVDGKTYAIISDYLGTPILSFDEQGNKIWERELGIYGNVKKGDSRFVPFLYQGQYYDEETNLAYNRFRYYNPDTGGYISQDPIGLASGQPNFYSYVKDSNSSIDPFGLHDILADTDIVTRAGTSKAEQFANGSGVSTDSNGKLSGVSTQAKPGAGLDVLSQPYLNGQVGVATVGDIEAAGGKITLDGKLNSPNGKMVMNHATVDGLTAAQSEKLFNPTQDNPIPKKMRGCK